MLCSLLLRRTFISFWTSRTRQSEPSIFSFWRIRSLPRAMRGWVSMTGWLLETLKRQRRPSVNPSLLDPLNDECIGKLADLLREEGYIREALKLIEDALSIAPWNAMHHYNYGRLLADINKIDEAREEFRKSLILIPPFRGPTLEKGLFSEGGQTERGLRRTFQSKPL